MNLNFVLKGAIIIELIGFRFVDLFVILPIFTDECCDYPTELGATFCRTCLERSVPITLGHLQPLLYLKQLIIKFSSF